MYGLTTLKQLNDEAVKRYLEQKEREKKRVTSQTGTRDNKIAVTVKSLWDHGD